MLIKLNETRVVGFKNILLVPGVNEIDAGTWAEMKANKVFAAKINEDLIELIDGTEDKSVSSVFLMMKPSAVRKLIDSTNSLDKLAEWFKAESRDSVRSLIKARIDVLSVVTYRDGSQATIPVNLEDDVTDEDLLGDVDTDLLDEPAPVKKGSSTKKTKGSK